MSAISWYRDAANVWLQSIRKYSRMSWDYHNSTKKMSPKRRQEVREDEREIRGRIVIVTGSNSGIGKETALQLAKRGAIVIMACRDPVRAESARQDILSQVPQAQLTILHLDLGDPASIRNFVAKFIECYPRLDVLVNNAGILSRKRSYTKDGFEMHMAVNYLGPFHLTLLLLDSLLKADSARIVFLSSMSAMTSDLRLDDWMMRAQPAVPGTGYANSKLALAMFSKQLSKLLAGTSVTTYAVCTGVVAGTNIVKNDALLQRLLNLAANYLKIKEVFSVEEGTENVLHCVLSKSLSGESGKFYRFLSVWDAPDKVMRRHSAEKLWELSETAVGLTGFAENIRARELFS